MGVSPAASVSPGNSRIIYFLGPTAITRTRTCHEPSAGKVRPKFVIRVAGFPAARSSLVAAPTPPRSWTRQPADSEVEVM